jgi:hypothetical protein
MIVQPKTCLIVGIVMLVIGSAARLIGLFSTVAKMLNTFDAVAASPSTPRPSDLANGLSSSLTGTGVGLMLGLVFESCGIVFIIVAVVAYFRHRRIHLSISIDQEDVTPTSQSARNASQEHSDS